MGATQITLPRKCAPNSLAHRRQAMDVRCDICGAPGKTLHRCPICNIAMSCSAQCLCQHKATCARRMPATDAAPRSSLNNAIVFTDCEDDDYWLPVTNEPIPGFKAEFMSVSQLLARLRQREDMRAAEEALMAKHPVLDALVIDPSGTVRFEGVDPQRSRRPSPQVCGRRHSRRVGRLCGPAAHARPRAYCGIREQGRHPQEDAGERLRSSPRRLWPVGSRGPRGQRSKVPWAGHAHQRGSPVPPTRPPGRCSRTQGHARCAADAGTADACIRCCRATCGGATPASEPPERRACRTGCSGCHRLLAHNLALHLQCHSGGRRAATSGARRPSMHHAHGPCYCHGDAAQKHVRAPSCRDLLLDIPLNKQDQCREAPLMFLS